MSHPCMACTHLGNTDAREANSRVAFYRIAIRKKGAAAKGLTPNAKTETCAKDNPEIWQKFSPSDFSKP